MGRFSIAVVVSLFWLSTVFVQNTPPNVLIAVYEGGFSFVEENRSVWVRKGSSRLFIEDLPAGIQPDTIVAHFPTKGGVDL